MATALDLASFFKREAEHYAHTAKKLQDLSDMCQKIAIAILEQISSDRIAFIALEAENKTTNRSALRIALEKSLNG